VSKQYDNQGRTEKAYRVLRDALQKAPDDKMLHEALAFHYLSAGSYSNDLVEDHFRRSFAVGDKNFEERFNLAQFLYLRGEVQKSVEMFDYINVHAPPEFRTMNPSKDNLITSKLSRFIGSIDRVREGYFFIKCAHYPRDIFSHRSASSLDIVDDLSVGQEVNFKMRFNRRGATAVDVKLGRYGATG
jgi:cold shock CspA family protein